MLNTDKKYIEKEVDRSLVNYQMTPDVAATCRRRALDYAQTFISAEELPEFEAYVDEVIAKYWDIN